LTDESVKTVLAIGLSETAVRSVGYWQLGIGVVVPGAGVVEPGAGVAVLPEGGSTVPVPTIPVVVGGIVADGVVPDGKLVPTNGVVNPVVGGMCVPVVVGTGGCEVAEGVVDTRDVKQAYTASSVVKVSFPSVVSTGVMST
jgi:hypothetical protein